MKKIAKLNDKNRSFIFNETSILLKKHPAIIEKDFWICFILDYLFTESKYKKYLAFKGGTSLSKGYDVINRMSEDIDLILDWTILGIKKDEPFLNRSKRQQLLFNEKLNDLAKEFIANDLFADLQEGLGSNKGVKIEVNKDEQIINIYYPRSFKVEGLGILPSIRLEIGPLASLSNTKNLEISPYVNNFSLNFDVSSTNVRTVSIERTFWEKVTILHRESNRSETKKMPKRYARHYYDTYQIFKSIYLKDVMMNIDLLKDVTKFKIKFYNDNWAKYEEILLGKIKIVPPQFRIKELKEDYESMKEMILDCPPSFDDILSELKKLEDLINLNITHFKL
jgi:predicted nucleotidyltransferase component of viral defense system